ncbi:MAG: arsenate reductase ArsC [Planctomycetales bacterium]|nr:arsenate reductase ArsC [Planctomycetales bacterium]
MSDNKPSILFLCTGNSCRSQMAEGWARKLHGDRFQVYSAGIEAHGLNPRAVQVMQEAGVDISGQRSQLLKEFDDVKLDVVISVCGHADKNCPVLASPTRRIHAPFDDPPALAKNATSEQEGLAHYRRVRDEIRDYVSQLPTLLARQ